MKLVQIAVITLAIAATTFVVWSTGIKPHPDNRACGR
jgi:hypothetical protein